MEAARGPGTSLPTGSVGGKRQQPKRQEPPECSSGSPARRGLSREVWAEGRGHVGQAMGKEDHDRSQGDRDDGPSRGCPPGCGRAELAGCAAPKRLGSCAAGAGRGERSHFGSKEQQGWGRGQDPEKPLCVTVNRQVTESENLLD